MGGNGPLRLASGGMGSGPLRCIGPGGHGGECGTLARWRLRRGKLPGIRPAWRLIRRGRLRRELTGIAAARWRIRVWWLHRHLARVRPARWRRSARAGHAMQMCRTGYTSPGEMGRRAGPAAIGAPARRARSALASASIPAGSGQPKRSRRSADGGAVGCPEPGGADERYPDQPASVSLRWTGGSASGSAVSPTVSATVGAVSGSPGGEPLRPGSLDPSARPGVGSRSAGSWAAGDRSAGAGASLPPLVSPCPRVPVVRPLRWHQRVAAAVRAPA